MRMKVEQLKLDSSFDSENLNLIFAEWTMFTLSMATYMAIYLQIEVSKNDMN